jgi:L-alanine-DL-glutamate epimerase-like enolase superfamily enzyme
MIKILTEHQTWPLKNPFVISRGSREETHVVKIILTDGQYQGSGECVPYARYKETISSVMQQIEQTFKTLASSMNTSSASQWRLKLQEILTAGAARNALDCALWDLEAAQSGQTVAEIIGADWPENINSVETISIGTPEKNAEDAHRLRNFPVIKVKLGRENILSSLKIIHQNAPKSALLLDANESWTLELLNEIEPDLHRLNVKMIEQPLPAADESQLRQYQGEIPLGADESLHTRKELNSLIGLYDFINIKLDKAGGLTEALALLLEGQDKGFQIMVGSMVSSSLSIAPAMFLAAQAEYIDLDSPSLLAKDREYGLTLKEGKLSPLDPKLWGGAL